MSRAKNPALERWALIGLILLATLLRLYRLGQESLWFDEGWSAEVARLPWPTLRSVLLTQPFAFYYGLLNLWASLGQSEFMLRLLSALSGIASVALLYPLTAPLLGRSQARMAMFLLAISPLHIWYSQEARMFALGTLMGLAATWAYFRTLSHSRWWPLYGILCALAFHTFYYTALIILGHGLFAAYLWWRRHTRPTTDPELEALPDLDSAGFVGWLKAMGLALLLFAPGLRVLLGQVTGGTWEWIAAKHGHPGLSDLVGTAFAYSLGATWSGPYALRWLGLSAFALACLAGISTRGVSMPIRWEQGRLVWRVILDKATLFWLQYLLLPIGLIFLASQIRPAYLIRYLIPFLPAYGVLAGKGIANLRPLSLRGILVGLILLTTTLSLADLYRGGHKEDWRAVAQHIEENGQPQDLILLVDKNIHAAFGYYYDGPLPIIGISGSLQSEAELEAVVQGLDKSAQRIWLVTSHVPNPALGPYLISDSRFLPQGDWQMVGIQLALFLRVG